MDGIDALTLGPADLAQDLGVFGTPEQAQVLDEKRNLILDAARRHGKTGAMLAGERRRSEEVEGRGRLAARLFERRRDAARRLFGDDEATEKLNVPARSREGTGRKQ